MKEIFNKDNILVTMTILTVIILLFIASIFYILKTKPLEEAYSFEDLGKVTLTTTYSLIEQKIYAILVFDDNIIEDWQVDYIDANEVSFDFLIKTNSSEFQFDYDGFTAEKGNKLIVKFYKNASSTKDYTELKTAILEETANLSLSTPKIFNSDKNIRAKLKKEWLAYKTNQEQIKKWQEHVYSNCVYKTQDGTCFTTKIIFTPRAEYNTRFENKDYWKTANDVCKSWGYKLPNDRELASLFSDLLGIEINPGLEVETERYTSSTIPLNYDLLKTIAPEGFGGRRNYLEWVRVDLWEDEEFDSERGYVRAFNSNEYRQVTKQTFRKKKNNQYASYICVYDPNGKAPTNPIRLKTSEEIEQEYSKKLQALREKSEKEMEQNLKKEDVENALF